MGRGGEGTREIGVYADREKRKPGARERASSARHDLSRMRKIRARSTGHRHEGSLGCHIYITPLRIRWRDEEREQQKIENRLLVDNRSFSALTVATEWLTEAMAPRED